MDRFTFDQKIADMLKRSPRQSFVIVGTNGSRSVVDDPQYVCYRDGIAGRVTEAGLPMIFYHHEVSEIVDS